MSHLKSILILSATASLLSAAPALAQYGSGSSGASLPAVSQPSAPSAKTSSKSISNRALKQRESAFSKKEELERKIARQEAQAKSYGSGDKAAKGAADQAKDKAYGSGKKAAEDKVQGVKDKAYGSGDKAAQKTDVEDAAPAEKSYGSGDKVKEAKDKAYGSGDKGVTQAKEKAHGSGTEAPASHGSGTQGAQPAAAEPAPTSLKPVNCPSGTTPQDNGTCLLTSGSL